MNSLEFSPIFIFLDPLLIIIAIAVFLTFIFSINNYKKTSYYQITNIPFFQLIFSKGNYGEYLIYNQLKIFEKQGAKFLFNLYVPKSNGETTEIDVIMICKKSIFVFESKHYSGWIFGDEQHKYWYQTLPTGRGRSHKESFYNPIMQNRSHIQHLESFLEKQLPIRSIIVFSDKCTLKNVTFQSDDISVIKSSHLFPVISCILENQCSNNISEEYNVDDIYNKLYPLTQTDEISKMQHIQNINHGSVTTMFKCPKCNGNLVIRTATKGRNAGNKFYGCSNYPRCKYTNNNFK